MLVNRLPTVLATWLNSSPRSRVDGMNTGVKCDSSGPTDWMLYYIGEVSLHIKKKRSRHFLVM